MIEEVQQQQTSARQEDYTFFRDGFKIFEQAVTSVEDIRLEQHKDSEALAELRSQQDKLIKLMENIKVRPNNYYYKNNKKNRGLGGKGQENRAPPSS